MPRWRRRAPPTGKRARHEIASVSPRGSSDEWRAPTAHPARPIRPCSTCPPHEEHQADDKCDDIGEIRVEAPRLQDSHARGDPQHCAYDWAVEVPLERRLNLRA